MTRSTLGWSAKSWPPAPYPMALDLHGRQHAERVRQGDGDGRAGGRGQLHRRAARINRRIRPAAARWPARAPAECRARYSPCRCPRSAASTRWSRRPTGRRRRTRPRYRRWNRPRPLRGSAPSRWATWCTSASASPSRRNTATASRLRARGYGGLPRSSSRCARDAGARGYARSATWYLVAPMPPRFTFSKETVAPVSSEAMASTMAV